MPEEPSTPVLTYAAPAHRRYPYVHAAAIGFSLLLLAVFYFGFVPSGAMTFDYTQEIPITEVIAGVLRRSPRDVLGDEFWRLVAFLSLGAIAPNAFVLVGHRRAKIAVSTTTMLLPLLIFPTIISFFANSSSLLLVLLILPALIVPALLGWCDGETWSEGIVAFGVLLDWMILWFMLTIIIAFRSRSHG